MVVLEQAGRTILARTRMGAMLITRGSRGMALFESGRPTQHISIYGGDEVADVTGAGDTVIATMAVALSVGAYVNLIPFNPIPYQNWESSEHHRIKDFAKNLQRRGVPAAIRETRGQDIDAACGQLRAHTLVQLEGSREREH